jgi:hypothetical protein
MTTYATADELRAELGVDAAALPDADANRLLEDAEDRVDDALGAWPVLETGRKLDVAPGVLAPAQIDAVNRATLVLAVAEYRAPGSLELPAYKSIKGPDFEKSDPIAPAGVRTIRRVRSILDATGLRILSGRATA